MLGLRKYNLVSTLTEYQFKLRVQKVPSPNVHKWLSHRFQEMGPTYIKIGQFISSRKDIFGDEVADAFQGLRDNVAPMSQSDAAQILQRLKKKHAATLAEVSPTPIACASIGQVHVAKTHKGDPLLVKIRRPGLRDLITEDISFLRLILSFASAFQPDVRETLWLLDEVEAFLIQELDMETESKNLRRFNQAFAEGVNAYVSEGITIPKVYDKMTDHDTLVMEYVPDIGMTHLKPEMKKKVARTLMTFFVRQLLEFGLMHGDPHKGNIGFTKNANIVLYDYGNVFDITKEERYTMKEMVYMLLAGNKYGVANSLSKLGVTIVDKDLLYDYIDVYNKYIRTIDIGVFKTINNIKAPPILLGGKMLRVLRTFGTLEGICKELDKDFNYFDIFDVYVTDLLMDDNFLMYRASQDLQRVADMFPNTIFKSFRDSK